MTRKVIKIIYVVVQYSFIQISIKRKTLKGGERFEDIEVMLYGEQFSIQVFYFYRSVSIPRGNDVAQLFFTSRRAL